MTTIEMCQEWPPFPTKSPLSANRLVVAWVEAPPSRRRTVTEACGSAAAIGAVAEAPAVLCWSITLVGALLAGAALVDVRERKLPNRLLAAAFLVALGGAAAAGDALLIAAALTGMALAGGLLLLVRLSRGVGMGDVKMAGVVGASVGPIAVVAAPLAIAVAAFVAGTYGLVTGRRRLPLGPALWLGWAISLLAAAAGWLR